MQTGQIISTATNICRDIANEPGNIMTPEEMANRAVTIANKLEGKLTCKIFEESDLANFGMGCFLGVAKAGSVPAKMIVL